MPSKRNKTKVMVGIYIERELRDEVLRVLREHGATMTDFFYANCLKLLRKEHDELIKIIENHDLRTREGKARLRARRRAAGE